MWRQEVRNKRPIESPPHMGPLLSVDPRRVVSQTQRAQQTHESATDHKRPRLLSAEETSTESKASSSNPLSRSQTPPTPAPVHPEPNPTQLPSPPNTAAVLPCADLSASSSPPRGEHEVVSEVTPHIDDGSKGQIREKDVLLDEDMKDGLEETMLALQSKLLVDANMKDGPEEIKALRMEVLELKRDRAYQQDLIDGYRRQTDRPRQSNDDEFLNADEISSADDHSFMLHTRAYFTHALFFSMIMGSGSSSHTLDIANHLARFLQSLADEIVSPEQKLESSMLEELFDKAWDVLQKLQTTLSTLDSDSFEMVLQEWRDGLLVAPAKIAEVLSVESVVSGPQDGMDIDMGVQPTERQAKVDWQTPQHGASALGSAPREQASEQNTERNQDCTDDVSQAEHDKDEQVQRLTALNTSLISQFKREQTSSEGARRQIQVLQAQLADREASRHNYYTQMNAKTSVDLEYAQRLQHLAMRELQTQERVKKAEEDGSIAREELNRANVVLERKEKMLLEEIQKNCGIEGELHRQVEKNKSLKADLTQRNQAYRKLVYEKKHVDNIIDDMRRQGLIVFGPPPVEQGAGQPPRTPSSATLPQHPTDPSSGPQSTHQSNGGGSTSRHSSGIHHSTRPVDNQPSGQSAQVPLLGASQPQASALPHTQLGPSPGHAALRLEQAERMRVQQQQHIQQLMAWQSFPSSGTAPGGLPHQQYPQLPAGYRQQLHQTKLDTHLGNAPFLSNVPQGQPHHHPQPSTRQSAAPQSNSSQEVAALYSTNHPLSPSPPLVSLEDVSQARRHTSQSNHPHTVIIKSDRSSSPTQHGGLALGSASAPRAPKAPTPTSARNANSNLPSSDSAADDGAVNAGCTEDQYLRAAVATLSQHQANPAATAERSPLSLVEQLAAEASSSSIKTVNGQPPAKVPQWQTAQSVRQPTANDQAQPALAGQNRWAEACWARGPSRLP